MRLVVLSDTHDHLPPALATGRIFRDLAPDAVIHLGDYVAPFTLKALLEKLPPSVPFYGVLGNNDGERMGLSRVAVGQGATLAEAPLEVTLSGKKILLIHGWGAPEMTRRIAEALADSGFWDVVLYGHTHEPVVARRSRTLLVNPGEAGGVLSGKATAAVIDLESMTAELVGL